jgi:hypothetical protein
MLVRASGTVDHNKIKAEVHILHKRKWKATPAVIIALASTSWFIGMHQIQIIFAKEPENDFYTTHCDTSCYIFFLRMKC